MTSRLDSSDRSRLTELCATPKYRDVTKIQAGSAASPERSARLIMNIQQTSPVLLILLFPTTLSGGVGAYFAFEGGLLWGGAMAVTLLLVVAALLSLAWVHIIVDQDRVVARSSIFRFPLLRVRLDQIADVNLDNAFAMNWGGWGYRKNAGDTALILHGSQAAVIEKTNGRKVLIVVDESERLADVLARAVAL